MVMLKWANTFKVGVAPGWRNKFYRQAGISKSFAHFKNLIAVRLFGRDSDIGNI